VERRAADALHPGGVQRVAPRTGGRVRVPLAAHLPDGSVVDVRPDCSLHPPLAVVGVEPRARLQHDDLVTAVGEGVRGERACRARAHDADVSARRRLPVHGDRD
jgi:hypothetical protein